MAPLAGQQKRERSVVESGSISDRIRGYAAGALIPLVLIAVWQTITTLGLISPLILPAPAAVLERGRILWESGELPRHILASLTRLGFGLLVGGTAGVVVGMATGVLNSADRLLSPVLRFLTPVPVLAWMPIVILFMGTGEAAKIVLMSLGVFFVLFAATYGAVRSLGEDYLEVARMLGKSRWTIVRQVVAPSALPAVFDGLRGALAISWVVLVAAEVVASQDGLGWLLWDARTFGRTADAYVAMLTVGLLGLVADALVLLLRNSIVIWRADLSGL